MWRCGVAEVTRQYESKHCVVTLTLRTKTTEAHSLLSQHRREYEDELGRIITGMDDGQQLSSMDQANAVDRLRQFDTVVDEHMKLKG